VIRRAKAHRDATRDASFNGTHVAGIIAAPEDGTGVVGVAPNAKLLAAKVVEASGAGSLSRVMSALDWAIQKGARVVNASVTSKAIVNIDAARCSEDRADVLTRRLTGFAFRLDVEGSKSGGAQRGGVRAQDDRRLKRAKPSTPAEPPGVPRSTAYTSNDIAIPAPCSRGRGIGVARLAFAILFGAYILVTRTLFLSGGMC
jgi:hypothetical protein